MTSMKPATKLVKIYGLGWVGKAVKKLFPDALVQDPIQGYKTSQRAEFGFVCVPTPLKDGELDCSIVEQVIRDADEDLIIVRSTVMPGFCDYIEEDKTIWEREPLEKLASNNQLTAFKHYGFWKPMDTLRDKMQMEKIWQNDDPAWKVWSD